MNNKFGVWSAIATTGSVVLFALLMLVRLDFGAYATSMLISWSYLVLACSFSAAANEERRAAAQTGVAFGILYAGFVTAVYFVQLTTVLHQAASPEILQLLTYRQLGSLMFNLDLLGYGLMSISTLFIGLTIDVARKTARWLRFLLILHGIFAPMCVVLPILNVFGEMPRSDGDAAGIAILVFWCVYFVPVGVLAILYFSQDADAVARSRDQDHAG